jgi:hypothetical protein
MIVLHAAVLAVMLFVQAPQAGLGTRSLVLVGQSFITREWTWVEGATTVTFTAYGPPEQVNALDPRDGPPVCPDCELASSIQFEPE